MTDVVGIQTVYAPAAGVTEKYIVEYNVGVDGGTAGSYYFLNFGEQVLVTNCYATMTENFAPTSGVFGQLVVYIPGVGDYGMNESVSGTTLRTTEVRTFAIRYADVTEDWSGVSPFPIIAQPGMKAGLKVTGGTFTAGKMRLVVHVEKCFV